MTVDGKASFEVTLFGNAAAKSLYGMLPLTLETQDMPYEKYCNTDFSLPVNVQKISYIEAET